MQTARFHIDTYLDESESCHFALKTLERTPPSVVHHHDYFELFMVENGRVRHQINGAVQELDRGAMVFMRPHDAHAVCAIGDRECRIMNVMFRADTANHLHARYEPELAGRYFWSDALLPETHQLEGPRLERAVNTALELQSAIRSLARIEEFLLTVMLRVVDLSAGTTKGMPSWLMSACQAARQPEVFREGTSGFVAAAGRSHEHVCRVAKQHLGLSPSAIVNRIRMEHAVMLLADREMPIQAVAEDCGIENLSYFYSQFRRHYGVSPRNYRLRQKMRSD